MRRHLFFLGLAVAVAGCTTERFTPEFDALSTIVSTTNTSVKNSSKFKALLAKADRDEIQHGAQNEETWVLNDACRANTFPTPGCDIEKIPFADAPEFDPPARKLKRKTSLLELYLSSLEVLMSTDVEDNLLKAYTDALGSFATFSETIEAEGLQEFLSERRERLPAAEAVASAAISAARYRQLKSTVTAADPEVSRLVTEIQDLLIETDLDPEFETRLAALENAEQAAFAARPLGREAYGRALEKLDTELSGFMTYYRGTKIYKYELVKEAHGALSRAMTASAKPEDVVSYLEALREVYDIVEGL